MATGAAERFSGKAGALVLALLVVASFFPAFSAGFVWDDVIFTESIIDGEVGLREIWFAPREIRREGHYWPLVYTGFWLEHKLWGAAPLGYHVTNLLLYVANVLLAWKLLLLLRLAAPAAWAAAAVWAVHPLHVESVVWVIERKDVLSGMFYLASAVLYLRFNESGRRGRYVLSLFLFACGLLSKSAVVTLPAAFLIWHWWRRGRLVKGDVLRTLPFFLVGLTITLADLAFYRSRETLDLGYSLVERVLIAGRALWFYAGKLAWPQDLNLIYPLWDVRAGDPLGWLFVIAAATVPLALWFGRRRFGRGPLAGTLFFAVTLSPALGFVDHGYMQFSFVADRFQYLAGLGLIAVVVGAFVRGVGRFVDPNPRTSLALLAPVLVLLGTLTWRQARIFSDEVTFFGHVISLNPEARGAHQNLSKALGEVGRDEESLDAARIALEQRPEWPEAHSDLGIALLRVADLEGAEQRLRTALELAPRHLNANLNLGEALRRQGRNDEAANHYRRALTVDPAHALSLAGLGETLVELGRHEEALAALERALVLFPTSPSVGAKRELKTYRLHVLAGKAARGLGRYAEAGGHLARAMELSPAGGEALLELVALRFAEGRSAEGRELLRRARTLGGGDPSVLHRAAESLRRDGQVEQAIAAYEEALDIDPGYAPALAGLGSAMHGLDRHQEAVELLDRALSLAPDLPEAAALNRVLGQSLLEAGRAAEAERRFELAVELTPPDPQALDHLALIRFQAGRHEEALELYRRRLEVGEDGAITHANMGVALYYLKRYEEAERSVLLALERDPELPVARALLVDLRRLLGGEPE